MGVGSAASGALVKIDRNDHLTVFEADEAPRGALTHVVANDEHLIASSQAGVHVFNFKTKSWQRLPKKSRWTTHLFQGKRQTIWASRYSQELFEFQLSGEVEDRYHQAWFPRGESKAGYRVDFVEELEDYVWFGGSPWRRFKSSGLYRVDKRTGEFRMYGPRDGFYPGTTFHVYDGVWTKGRLWLATLEDGGSHSD